MTENTPQTDGLQEQIELLRQDLVNYKKTLDDLIERLIGDFDNPGGILVVIQNTQRELAKVSEEVSATRARVDILENQVNNFRDTTIKFFVKLILGGAAIGLGSSTVGQWLLELLQNIQ